MTLGMKLEDVVPDGDLLKTALTHSSYAHEVGGAVAFNERLEFLGDAVVQLAVTDWLYRRHPEWGEGRLSEARASVVRESSLAKASRRLGLGRRLRLGRGEALTGGRDKPSLLADAFEAVVGACYLSMGVEGAAKMVVAALQDALDASEHLRRDYKTLLAERVIRTGSVPRYQVVEESGPEHDKRFTVSVCWGGAEQGRGSGRSKKEAEQAAAAAAWGQLSPEPG
jgi:ribonuclease-3